MTRYSRIVTSSRRGPGGESDEARYSPPAGCQQSAGRREPPAGGRQPPGPPRSSAASRPAARQPASLQPDSADPALSWPQPGTPAPGPGGPGAPKAETLKPSAPEPNGREPGGPKAETPELDTPPADSPKLDAPRLHLPTADTPGRTLTAPPAATPGSSAGQEAVPSWATVLGTTFRLWAQRHLPGRGQQQTGGGTRRRGPAAAAIGIICLVIALIVVLASGVLTSAGRSRAAGRTGSGSGSSGVVAAVAASRQQAASWIAAQVSSAAIVACDPVMCAAIQARGFPPANLETLGPSSNDPLGSNIVVATPAVRGQFGSRLSQVYAPVIIASFGSGAASIDIRVTAAGGAAAYLGALRADVASRQQIGSELVHNSRLAAAPAARAELAAGQVDSRLLMTLAALTAAKPVEVRAFGDSGPGASPGVPLRSATLAVVGTGTSGRSYLQWLLAFLDQQRAPYKAASMRVLPAAGGTVVQIEFSAPTVPGLLVNSP